MVHVYYSRPSGEGDTGVAKARKRQLRREREKEAIVEDEEGPEDDEEGEGWKTVQRRGVAREVSAV